LGHSSDGPSWIDLAAIRLNATESRFPASLNRLLQQNRHQTDVLVKSRRSVIEGSAFIARKRPEVS
ncbi:hypothetical protein, partial [Bradyrhizobium sp.]|uniref:hypothetical protein n=1 Tax=Bradyrhizobium sp. TaxID=376 RepID=UPI003C53CE72